jgi:hypothetical protein
MELYQIDRDFAEHLAYPHIIIVHEQSYSGDKGGHGGNQPACSGDIQYAKTRLGEDESQRINATIHGGMQIGNTGYTADLDTGAHIGFKRDAVSRSYENAGATGAEGNP